MVSFTPLAQRILQKKQKNKNPALINNQTNKSKYLVVLAISLAKIFKARKIALSRKQKKKRKYAEIDNAENMKTEEIIEEDK